MALRPLKEGEWVIPHMRSHILTCCDCGLKHKMDFVVIDAGDKSVINGVEVMFRAYRTAKRKKKKNVK